MKALVVKLSALGDILHAMPAVRRLLLEEINVSWAVDARYAGVLELFPGLDNIHIIDPKGWGRSARVGKLFDAFGQMRAEVVPVRVARYDVVLDVQGLIKSAIIARMSGAGKIVGFSKEACREGSAARLYHQRVDTDSLEPVEDQIMNVFAKGLGIRNDLAPSGLIIPETGVRRAEGLLGKSRPVVLVVGAGWPTKLIPPATMNAIVESFASIGPLVVLSGNDTERETALALSEGRDNVFHLHREDIVYLAGVMSMAKVVIGGDTGLIHLAAQLGAATVSIYGPSLGTRSGPRGDIHRWVQSEADCSPCFKRECDNFICMDMIGPDAIVDQVKGVLAEK